MCPKGDQNVTKTCPNKKCVQNVSISCQNVHKRCPKLNCHDQYIAKLMTCFGHILKNLPKVGKLLPKCDQNSLGICWAHFGNLWIHFGKILDTLKQHLDIFWQLLGIFWQHLGTFWQHLGTLWQHFGYSLAKYPFLNLV